MSKKREDEIIELSQEDFEFYDDEPVVKKLNIKDSIRNASQKGLWDNKVHETSVEYEDPDGNKFIYDFSYKKLKKKDYLAAEAKAGIKGGIGKMFDVMLTKTLYDPDEKRFFTIKEINEGINPMLQNQIMAKIMEESGYTLKQDEVGF